METKAKHSRPTNDSEGPSKKKVKTEEEEEDEDLGFGFNNKTFSDHTVVIKGTVNGKQEEDVVYVSKIICSKFSQWFKQRARENPSSTETVIELSPEFTIAHMKDLLRWMYFSEFESTGADLLRIMSLAQKYQFTGAVRKCASELSSDMTIERACSFLSQEASLKDSDGFIHLWKDATEFLQQEFKELNIATITSENFNNLTVDGLQAILKSDSLHIGTENTVFMAFRQWIHHDFENRKQHATVLLPHIKFTQVRNDFLLDVVKKEGEMNYPEDAKKLFAKKIIEAYVYHTTSPERREALKLPGETPRVYDELLLKDTFTWKVEPFKDQKEVWSPPFFLGGYFLHLLLQRKAPTQAGGGTIGLYLHIKVDSGLADTFYVPLAFELLVKNQRTGKYVSPKGAYPSPFTATNKAWGYVDIISTTWDDFFKDSPYNAQGSIEVKANVWLKDYWERTKNIRK